MPDIGATLREARMRSRIDISEIEAETKIRAKYLRALENEEWDLLPGPTYVKTFLRTYAEALGLDARLLVEEYKLRHERISEHDLLRPMGGAAASGRGRARRPPPAIPRAYLVWGALLVLLALLLVLNNVGGGGKGNSPSVPTTAARSTHRGAAKAHHAATKRPKPVSRFVSLRLIPTSDVWVCLVAAGNRKLVPGVTLTAGQPTQTFRSSAFALNLGNSAVRLVVNGHAVTVPASSTAIGLRITRHGRATLPVGQRPTCA